MATKKSAKKAAGKKKPASKKPTKKPTKKPSTIKPRVVDLRKRGSGDAKAVGRLFDCPGDCSRLTVATGNKPTHLLIVI